MQKYTFPVNEAIQHELGTIATEAELPRIRAITIMANNGKRLYDDRVYFVCVRHDPIPPDVLVDGAFEGQVSRLVSSHVGRDIALVYSQTDEHDINNTYFVVQSIGDQTRLRLFMRRPKVRKTAHFQHPTYEHEWVVTTDTNGLIIAQCVHCGRVLDRLDIERVLNIFGR